MPTNPLLWEALKSGAFLTRAINKAGATTRKPKPVAPPTRFWRSRAVAVTAVETVCKSCGEAVIVPQQLTLRQQLYSYETGKPINGERWKPVSLADATKFRRRHIEVPVERKTLTKQVDACHLCVESALRQENGDASQVQALDEQLHGASGGEG